MVESRMEECLRLEGARIVRYIEPHSLSKVARVCTLARDAVYRHATRVICEAPECAAPSSLGLYSNLRRLLVATTLANVNAALSRVSGLQHLRTLHVTVRAVKLFAVLTCPVFVLPAVATFGSVTVLGFLGCFLSCSAPFQTKKLQYCMIFLYSTHKWGTTNT